MSNRRNKKEPTDSVPAKFREFHNQIQMSLQKHLEDEAVSSDEEDNLETENILDGLLKNYAQFGGKSEDLGRTQNFLENSFHSGAAVCLICIGSVKRDDSIWSCESCYGFFHLVCIQRWAKDSIAHQKMSAELRGESSASIMWQCPKCRKDYQPSTLPNKYLCFCGNVRDPKFHPWLVPHSCGESCNRPLKPECGHLCLLLCHPGPCPPCPKTINVPCHCGKGSRKPVRCSEKGWSCSSVCGKNLLCKNHRCKQTCHEGPCPPCGEQSLVTCCCNSETKLLPCTQLTWQCPKVCEKALSCGEHSCLIACHAGACGDCPRTRPRSCPCGKDTATLPCTEEIATCGGTCNKVLDCGIHSCSERCHRGPCGTCLERSVKTCRCGQHKKEVQCQKEYFCETKCKRMRDCNIHPCNRKCCDGSCPTCEKPCGKTLKCGQHKCTSICHPGSCYPCNLTKTISCYCGGTAIVVPCGAARKTSPPKCNKLCKIPPNCHHLARQPHRCHFGECPPCSLKCSKTRPCSHQCIERCHSAVLVPSDPTYKPATPWEKMTTPHEVKDLPCPPCPVLVPVDCPGGHETIMIPCHGAVSRPCGKVCGRQLPCSNHVCQLQCHSVKGAVSSLVSGDNCEPCYSSCLFERSCTHDCPKPCHPPPCPECGVNIKMKCHCGLLNKFIKCSAWVRASIEERDKMLACGNQCPRTFECGHRCSLNCHGGECPASQCTKKVKLSCPCKNLKRDFPCHLVSSGEAKTLCSDKCKELQKAKKKAEEEERERQKLEESRRHQKELEEFEKKTHGRRRNRKRNSTSSMEHEGLGKFKIILGALSVAAVGILVWVFTR